MTAQEFVDLVDRYVGQAAIHAVHSQLQKPSGRRPAAHVSRMSDWFNRLADADRAMVSEVVAETAASTLFGFYCLLDGSRTILDDSEHERIDLTYHNDDGATKIASTDVGETELLHELRGPLT